MSDYEIKNMALDDIEPNDYNPNSMDDVTFDKEVASIEEFGFVIPIVVNRQDGNHTIIDGEHRWKAAKKLGLEEVPCVIMDDVSEERAKALTVILNSLKGEHDPLGVGSILRQLEGMDNILDIMPYTPQEMDNMMALGDIDWEDFGETDFNESDNTNSRKEEVEFKYGDMHFKTSKEKYEVIKDMFLIVASVSMTEEDALERIFVAGAKVVEDEPSQ